MENNDTSYTQIFIAKIHPRVSERDLKYKFKKFGEIQDIRLKRGYAFIDFENAKDAQQAVERMNGKEVEGQPIVVQPSSKTGKREGRREENSDNNRTERRGPLPEDKCFNCDKTGHWANECREPKRSRRERDLDDFKCFSCGERGHKQRFCRKNHRRGDSRDRHYRRRRSSVSKSRSRSSSSDSRSRSRSKSRSRSRSNSDRGGRINHRYRSVSRSNSRRNYRRRSSENGK